jgi:hypothetical protein
VVFLIKNRVKRSQGLAKEKTCPTNGELPADSKNIIRNLKGKFQEFFFVEAYQPQIKQTSASQPLTALISPTELFRPLHAIPLNSIFAAAYHTLH